DILVRGVVLQDAVGQAGKGPVIDQGQDTERAVVEFVDGEVAAKVLQGAVEVVGLQAGLAFFFRRPRPSSGSWPKGRRPDGPATNANWPSGTAGRPRPPSGPRCAGRGGCSGTWGGRGRPCRR